MRVGSPPGLAAVLTGPFPSPRAQLTLWNLLDVQANTGMALTESLAMTPAASVSGLYFAHPQSAYFAVGKVAQDQVASYAARKSVGVADCERWLAPILAYDA